MAQPAFQHIDLRHERGVAIVTILDAQLQSDAEVEGLRRELHLAADAQPCKKWALDFRHVEHFNTAALRPLLSLHRKINAESGRIVLCQVRAPLREVLQVTRLIDGPGAPFDLAADLQEAVARLKNFSEQVVAGVLVLRMTRSELHGEALAEDLGTEMQAALAEHDGDRLVLDFAEVGIMSTPCMRPLLQIRGAIKKRGGRIAFAHLSPHVAEIFTVTRLIAPAADGAGLFETYPNNEAAIQAFK